MEAIDDTFKVTKLDAARRQLKTAIDLWFYGGDPVAVHTLSFAAYEVIHFVSRDKGRTRDLLLDTLIIKPEHLRDWQKRLKEASNFFKHADRDPNGELDFNPLLNNFLILFSILGLDLMALKKNSSEVAFIFWLGITRPSYLTDLGKKELAKSFPGESLEKVKSLPRKEFYDAFVSLRENQ